MCTKARKVMTIPLALLAVGALGGHRVQGFLRYEEGFLGHFFRTVRRTNDILHEFAQCAGSGSSGRRSLMVLGFLRSYVDVHPPAATCRASWPRGTTGLPVPAQQVVL
jgi:hypothetical protein